MKSTQTRVCAIVAFSTSLLLPPSALRNVLKCVHVFTVRAPPHPCVCVSVCVVSIKRWRGCGFTLLGLAACEQGSLMNNEAIIATANHIAAPAPIQYAPSLPGILAALNSPFQSISAYWISDKTSSGGGTCRCVF